MIHEPNSLHDDHDDVLDCGFTLLLTDYSRVLHAFCAPVGVISPEITTCRRFLSMNNLSAIAELRRKTKVKGTVTQEIQMGYWWYGWKEQG
jgi:hypothetical protein